MSAKELYGRFVTLCQKWPTDPTKSGRDYGEFFRQRLGEKFTQGELGQVKDQKAVESALDSLEKIASNEYFVDNPLKRCSSTGLEASACRLVISNEGLKELGGDDSTLLDKLKKLLSIKFKV